VEGPRASKSSSVNFQDQRYVIGFLAFAMRQVRIRAELEAIAA